MNNPNEKTNRRASNNENQNQMGDIGDPSKDARGGATRDLNFGPAGAAGNSSSPMKGQPSFNRENENLNVDQQKFDLDMRQKFTSQRHAIDSNFQSNQKVHGLLHQQSKNFKQQPSLQSQNKKSNIYIIDFSQKQKLDFEITKKLDLLSKADLKQQIQKFMEFSGTSHNQDTWKLIGTIFGNLSKNALFSDLNRSSQTNLIFWRQKIQIWKNHPLGLGGIYRLLEEFQQNMDFVQFCILAATLFEYELRIYKHMTRAH